MVNQQRSIEKFTCQSNRRNSFSYERSLECLSILRIRLSDKIILYEKSESNKQFNFWSICSLLAERSDASWLAFACVEIATKQSKEAGDIYRKIVDEWNNPILNNALNNIFRDITGKCRTQKRRFETGVCIT